MPAFLEEYSKFYGDGSCNERGETLDEFLENYNPGIYRSPSVTADIMVFRHSGRIQSTEAGLSLLMIQRRDHPCIGLQALPGGFANMDEDLVTTARRELEEETGLRDIPLEQVYTWGEVWRDPRDRIITTSYLAIVDDSIAEPKAGDDAKAAAWFEVSFTEKDNGNQERVFELTLSHPSENIKCTACVKVSYKENCILKQKEYEILESSNLAFDHARFIVQGLLYIQESLEN